MTPIRILTVLFVIGFVSLSSFGGENAPQLPRYVGDFLSKMGISANMINDPVFLNESVPAAALKVGLDQIQRTAQSAKDPLTGGAYYKIDSVAGGGVLIERHYPLMIDVRELRLYLYTDASGRLVRAGFAVGIRD
jgi:hypothetical protein